MRYFSTRSRKNAVSFSQAITSGLAPDGGLNVPEQFPTFQPLKWEKNLNLLQVAEKIIPEWLDDFETDSVSDSVREICQSAFSFPIPLKFVEPDVAFLELFHGPTAAFKDVGARFLAECLIRIPARNRNSGKRIVLVATSGDTGGAVAAAFFKRPGIDVVILYPRGGVSKRQEMQLTTWGRGSGGGGNVQALSVRGTFDDCQRLVKEAFTRSSIPKEKFLSANSINLGRLLPQTFYYAWSSLNYFHQRKEMPGFIIPTGNLGNAVAALWAKKMGFPIREVVLATNANRSILEYFSSGKWAPRPTVSTLANAMDVGNPSNMERLLHLYPTVELLQKDVSVASINDSEIRETIQYCHKTWGYLVCPHTATAASAWRKISNPRHWILVATAHPAKFETIVEPLVHVKIEVPESLRAILSRKEEKIEIEANLADLEDILIRRLS